MIQALLLDLDGTLVDSEPWHKAAEIEAFGLLGIQLSEEDLFPFMGRTLPDLLSGMGQQFGRTISVKEFLEVEHPILLKYIQEEMQIFEDAEELLSMSTLPAAIVTSSMKWYVDSVLERFRFLEERTQLRICQADVPVGKPDPFGYLMASRKLGVEAASCLVIEDSVNGVRAGLAAGAHVVGIDRESIGHLVDAHTVVQDLRHPDVQRIFTK